VDVQRLRSETRVDHEAVEASFPLMRMGLCRSEYVSCLQRLHGVVMTWEEAASGWGKSESGPDWLRLLVEKRRRRPMLDRDLAHFKVLHAEGGRPVMPDMRSTTSLLGAMYVMEGSTLGGQLIGRHVDHALGLVSGKGSAYFHGHRELTGAMWKEFCGVLETEIPEADGDAAVAAAKAMFHVFGAWMQGSKP
jgi:heme oxygenase